MYVGAIGSIDSVSAGGIDPYLMSRYATLNKQLKLKRLREEVNIDPLDIVCIPRIESYETTLTVGKLREIYANPISKSIPIKIAYTILQRLCNETLRISQNTDYIKQVAFRMDDN